MSLIKLIKSPTRLFKKDVITFLIIRRHDLGILDEKFRYIAVKPSASISNLRQKIWHLLDLPDYCEEIIILKTEDDQELPLTYLRKGNEPHHPFILEVWLPNKQKSTGSLYSNMITMVTNKTITKDNFDSQDNLFEEKISCDNNEKDPGDELSHTITKERIVPNNFQTLEQKPIKKYKEANKNSELSCKISSSSIFFKLHGRKSRDNFANILLKIQNDLSTLNTKLSDLENRIQI